MEWKAYKKYNQWKLQILTDYTGKSGQRCFFPVFISKISLQELEVNKVKTKTISYPFIGF
jgi:hypothetical protein